VPRARSVAGVTSGSSGNGGGVSVSVPDDSQRPQDCPGPPPSGSLIYWPYTHSTFINVTNSTFANNTALSPTSSGGGLYLSSGGLLAISGTSFRGNDAGWFGGGIGIGSGGSSATCALHLLSGTTLADNTAGHGGAQVYMGCTADVLVDESYVALTPVGTQVSPGGGLFSSVMDLCCSILLLFWPFSLRCLADHSAASRQCSIRWWDKLHLPHWLQLQ
jgi:hypothetical protein